MSRSTSFRSFSLALAVAAIAAQPLRAAEHASPPNSHSYGGSLTDWMRSWWEHAIAGTVGTEVGHVRILELPPSSVFLGGSGTSSDPGLFEGTTDVDMRVGTAFVLPVAFWYGERYNTGQQDDAILPASVFTASSVLITKRAIASVE